MDRNPGPCASLTQIKGNPMPVLSLTAALLHFYFSVHLFCVELTLVIWSGGGFAF